MTTRFLLDRYRFSKDSVTITSGYERQTRKKETTSYSEAGTVTDSKKCWFKMFAARSLSQNIQFFFQMRCNTRMQEDSFINKSSREVSWNKGRDKQ